MSDKRKFVVHPLPASFGGGRFPAHQRGDTSCPTCAHEADLERQLVEVQGKLKRVHLYCTNVDSSSEGAAGVAEDILDIVEEGEVNERM